MFGWSVRCWFLLIGFEEISDRIIILANYFVNKNLRIENLKKYLCSNEMKFDKTFFVNNQNIITRIQLKNIFEPKN